MAERFYRIRNKDTKQLLRDTLYRLRGQANSAIKNIFRRESEKYKRDQYEVVAYKLIEDKEI